MSNQKIAKKSNMENKIQEYQNIIQKTILSAQKYKLYDILGANELNICISTLDNIFEELNNLDIKSITEETFKKFQDQWASNETPIQNIKNSEVPDFVKNFLTFTFKLINEGKPHKIAAAFTYGRETIIPDMFLEILDTLNFQEEKTIEPLKYYLQRHIELDGDEHGPMAFDMLQSLCDSGEKWEEVIQTSNEAINVRIKFWDALNLELKY